MALLLRAWKTSQESKCNITCLKCLMAAINRRNEAQKRCNASWIPTEEDRDELRAARKAVRRAVEDAREA